MRILKLVAENFKRLKVVSIAPESGLTVVGGRNGQGKSSTLDAVMAALGGKKFTPDMPVRQGQVRAKVTLDIGDGDGNDIKVTRTFTPEGGGTIVIEGKDGARFPSPQAMLDSLIGKQSFDPLQFERMKDDEQAETLRKMVGLDTSDLDADHQATYNQRTDRNRVVKQLEGQLAGLNFIPGLPEKEVSIVELTKDLEVAQATQAAFDAGRTAFERAQKELKDADVNVARAKDAIVELQRQLAAAEHALTVAVGTVTEKMAALEIARAKGRELVAARIETAPILDRMKHAESINTKVRQNIARAKVEVQLSQEREESKMLTDKLDTIEKLRAERIAAASFPVPGLSVDGTKVLFDGVPFRQASQAQRLRVSAAIGFALNPKLKLLLIREGSSLDSQSLQLLSDLAEEMDGQILLEAVRESHEGCSVLIEDGAVMEAAVNA